MASIVNNEGFEVQASEKKKLKKKDKKDEKKIEEKKKKEIKKNLPILQAKTMNVV